MKFYRCIAMLALALLGAAAALAQPTAQPAPVAPVTSPTPEVKDDAAAPASPPEDRVFRPTEEVSPDNEVDFPADL